MCCCNLQENWYGFWVRHGKWNKILGIILTDSVYVRIPPGLCEIFSNPYRFLLISICNTCAPFIQVALWSLLLSLYHREPINLSTTVRQIISFFIAVLYLMIDLRWQIPEGCLSCMEVSRGRHRMSQKKSVGKQSEDISPQELWPLILTQW